MSTNDLISLLANIALALSFIVGLIFGIAQVRAASRDRKERLTLEALNNYQTREFAELMQYINAHDLPASAEELRALPVNEQVIFIQLAQQMETLGILVADRYINLDLVDKVLGSFVFTTWEKYKNMVFSIRESDPFVSEYFQWLAEKIDERLKNDPREPFYKKKLRLR
jgi:hypothetical protein